MFGLVIVRCMELMHGEERERKNVKFDKCRLSPKCNPKIQSFMYAFGTCCQNYKT